MTVKDKITGKILNTNSVWLAKKWKKQPKRYITNFQEEEKPQKKTSKKKEVEDNGIRD